MTSTTTAGDRVLEECMRDLRTHLLRAAASAGGLPEQRQIVMGRGGMVEWMPDDGEVRTIPHMVIGPEPKGGRS